MLMHSSNLFEINKRFGAFPHGGCAFGLERVVFLYFNLKNIRNATLFPRDPVRLFP